MTEKLRELLAAATPGPWVIPETTDSRGKPVPNKEEVYAQGVAWPHVLCFGHDYDEYGSVEPADAAFIAAARNAMPLLLDVVEAAQFRHHDSPIRAGKCVCGQTLCSVRAALQALDEGLAK